MVRTTPTPTPQTKTKQKPGPKPGQGGRPPKQINYRILDNLCKIQCTETEIAATLELHTDTINRHIHEDFGVSFTEYVAEKALVGKRSLRRKQYELALKGNVTMLIWLGKNYLGQADKHEIMGANGGPIRTDQTMDLLSKIPQDKLDALEEMVTMFRTGNGVKK